MSSNSESAPVEGPRPFTITPDDHRGVVMSLAVLFIIYAFMIIGLRLAARMRTMGVDDWLAILATVFSVVQFSLVAGAVHHLFGVSFDFYSSDDAVEVAKLLRASDVFLFISLFVAKAAVIWLCRRLFSVNQKAPKLVCEIALGLSACWCLASILAVTIGCDEQAAIGLGTETCPGLMKRWTIVGILDAAIEALIITLSIIVVWPLRMTLSRRLSAISCFLFRMPIVIFIGLHLYYLSRFVNGQNKGVNLTRPVIFRQAELLFSLFSAAIPALNQYLRKFQTASAATFGYRPDTYAGNTYGLKSFTSRTRGGTGRVDPLQTKDSFAPTSSGNYLATVDYGNAKEERSDDGQDGLSMGRHNSDDMIIRKDVVYEISYSDGDEALGKTLSTSNIAKNR